MGGVVGLVLGIIAVVLALILLANKDDNTATWLLFERLLGGFGAVLSALAVHELVD